MNILLIFLGIALSIALLEFLAWLLFHARIAGVVPPREFDTSIFRFLSPLRLQFFAIGHTVFLIVSVAIFLFVLW